MGYMGEKIWDIWDISSINLWIYCDIPPDKIGVLQVSVLENEATHSHHPVGKW